MFFDPFKKKKKEKELILVKPIKKSKYLKNLEKQKYEGLKLIEVEKAELLIDRILKRERFVRDYTIIIKIMQIVIIMKEEQKILILMVYIRIIKVN